MDLALEVDVSAHPRIGQDGQQRPITPKRVDHVTRWAHRRAAECSSEEEEERIHQAGRPATKAPVMDFFFFRGRPVVVIGGEEVIR
jgi:hypothetical protein